MPEHIRENISAPPAVQIYGAAVTLVRVEAQVFEVYVAVAKTVPAAVVAVAAMAAAGVALLCRGRRAVRDSCLGSYCRIYYP